MHFKHYLNVLLVITFFCLVFHMTLNNCNTKLGLLGFVRYSDLSFKVMYFVF